MSEVTVEELAVRVESLEAEMARLRPTIPAPFIRSSWDEVMQAVEALRDSDYDWDAWKEQREYSRKRAEDHSK